MQNRPAVHVLDATEARQSFGQVIKRVYSGREHLIIEKNGLPVAVILSVSEYEELRRAAALQNLEALGDALHTQAQATALTPEDIEKETERTKQEIYEEIYGRRAAAR